MSALTIAVTGAAGRIGSAVARMALAHGHTVLALDRPGAASRLDPQERYSYLAVDLTNYAAFRDAVLDAECNAIVHLAAVYSQRSPTDPEGPFIVEIPEHEIHNTNTAASWNALQVAAELGIDRIVLASSVNAIGMVFSKRPRFDYVPVDENHPYYPEDAYSVCKQEVEVQAAAFARRYPTMRIATLRFHWVIEDSLAADPQALHAAGGTWRDLWGWVSLSATSRSCLLGLTAPLSTFPLGYETFFIVGDTTTRMESTASLLQSHFPEVTDVRRPFKGNEALIDSGKAARMLGWTEHGTLWIQ